MFTLEAMSMFCRIWVQLYNLRDAFGMQLAVKPSANNNMFKYTGAFET